MPGNSLVWKSAAARVTAPEGSGTMSDAVRRTLSAVRISSSLTVTMPSTNLRMCSKLSWPRDWVRRPSQRVRVVFSAGH